jgi:hypothetical protein
MSTSETELYVIRRLVEEPTDLLWSDGQHLDAFGCAPAGDHLAFVEVPQRPVVARQFRVIVSVVWLL